MKNCGRSETKPTQPCCFHLNTATDCGGSENSNKNKKTVLIFKEKFWLLWPDAKKEKFFLDVFLSTFRDALIHEFSNLVVVLLDMEDITLLPPELENIWQHLNKQSGWLAACLPNIDDDEGSTMYTVVVVQHVCRQTKSKQQQR